MAELPLEAGAVIVSVTCPFPATAVGAVGVPGAVAALAVT